jgi:hypothetical protein
LKLTTLILSNNEISDDGAKSLAVALPGCSLTSLSLSGNNITGAGVASLVETLLKSRIELLNLYLNPINQEGLERLRKVNGKENIDGKPVVILVQEVGVCLEYRSRACQDYCGGGYCDENNVMYSNNINT